MTSYDVIVGTKVSYRVEVEAESFNQAAEKALDYVHNVKDIQGQIANSTRCLVPCEVINDINSAVELIHVYG